MNIKLLTSDSLMHSHNPVSRLLLPLVVMMMMMLDRLHLLLLRPLFPPLILLLQLPRAVVLPRRRGRRRRRRGRGGEGDDAAAAATAAAAPAASALVGHVEVDAARDVVLGPLGAPEGGLLKVGEGQHGRGGRADDRGGLLFAGGAARGCMVFARPGCGNKINK